MGTNANFATTPRYEVAQATTANTNFDGTGTIATLFTAGTNGSRIDQIGWCAAGTSLAGLLNMFVRESSEDTWRLMFSMGVPAITASTTTAPWSGGATNLNWVLVEGAQVGVSTTVANTINVHVSLAGDFS